MAGRAGGIIGGSITNKKEGQPLAIGVSNDREGSEVVVRMKKILIISVFFDGTRNNMHNTKLGRENPAYKNKDISYENYYSNVALLYMAFKETKIQKCVYIQGSGSAQGEIDDTKGLAFSTGPTGVEARIKEAFEKIEKIRIKADAKQVIFNLFGFSRGSFFARYFCHLLTTEPRQNGLDMDRRQVNLNFMGLYDTVSSAGIKHYNDVKEFKLNIGKTHGIRKLVHITAQNEYRNHFPLTRVNTAVNHGIAFECSLPGAHSDIGGGYSESSQETQYISRLNSNAASTSLAGEIDWQWFKSKGYYKGEPKTNSDSGRVVHKEITYGQFMVESKSYSLGTAYRVYANRTLTYHYQFIPLEIMRDIAIKQANLSFDGEGSIAAKNGIAAMKKKPLLNKFRNHAYAYLMEHYHKVGLQFAVQAEGVLTAAESQSFYNQYIHNSLNPSDIANGSDARNKGPKRIVINDHA